MCLAGNVGYLGYFRAHSRHNTVIAGPEFASPVKLAGVPGESRALGTELAREGKVSRRSGQNLSRYSVDT